jgi:Uma2 family endonuclease
MAVRRGVRFLATDIWDTPDDGKRYEVIDGELYVTPPPKWSHQRGLSKLHIRLGAWIYDNNLGEMVEAPVGVVLDEHNGLQPDIVYVSRERLHIISERGVEGAPDLVVEALSPSTRARDKGVKMRRYAAAGVSHYWQLDPRTEFLDAYRLIEQDYELTGRYGPGSVFRPELFPGLEIPIDELWR